MRFTVLLLLLPLAGCFTPAPSPDMVADDLTHRYYGRPANQFFFDHGQPVAEFTLADGGKIYHWSSAGTPYMPYAHSYKLEMAENYQGATANYDCEVRIYTDPDGVVDDVSVAVDSMGKWSASRCSEVF